MGHGHISSAKTRRVNGGRKASVCFVGGAILLKIKGRRPKAAEMRAPAPDTTAERRAGIVATTFAEIGGDLPLPSASIAPAAA
jgi:hypothetical protein